MFYVKKRAGDNTNNIEVIKGYLLSNMYDFDLYIKCLDAKTKYYHTDYYYTDEDYDNFLMLASAWSAIIRKAWRLFIKEGIAEPSEFWDAFIMAFIFTQTIFMNSQWENMNKYHKKLKDKIKRTSNPKFIEKMFTGMDWKCLLNELCR